MLINNQIYKYSIAIILAFMMTVAMPLQAATAAAPATLSYGDSGPDVPDLQFRLKTLGYFDNTAITTFYGKMTEEAVRKFQADYGLKSDGVAEEKTWTQLKKVSANQEELDLLARIVYAEARGESYKGQVAVAAVVLNRLDADGFPKTIKGVIEQSGAFTAVDDGQYYLKPDSTAYKAALDALGGKDPSNGALYYFNPKTATSKWIWSRKQTVQIGNHIFAV
ncbi:MULTISPECIES: cell wall hydrolase [unclassified Paenibacillus]|uniref:cell wall hydrolase n=1 Tax=unclassified Paenibacillus TaxID=185978 RepID=UPI00104C377F|nr:MULTISPECIES: cell wall hydrolase [unclassified Paenibacillus]NIK68008.1 N-acetylmuramoyl-L-alanine amidase [Paenibacillus sp. BK720]TCN01982.1 N-acetylmuramoyl-L-alanine amidase [Paenibacillus sp. BK033]